MRDRPVAKVESMRRAMIAALRFGVDYPPAQSEIEKLKSWPDVYQPTREYIARRWRKAA